MGARNFTAGIVLLVVFLNNIQALEAVPTGDSAHGSQRKFFPDFRQISPELAEERMQIVKDLGTCFAQFGGRATVAARCNSRSDIVSEYVRIGTGVYGTDAKVNGDKATKLLLLVCHKNLECSTAGQCECKGRSEDSSSCDVSGDPDTIFLENCKREFDASQDFVRRNSPSSVSDPSQNFQYIILMAVILSFVVAI